jgi:acid phosphatase family membrane protein YuiD
MTLKERLKTSEFWLSILAILVGAIVGAGFIGDGTIYAKIGGWIVTALGAVGYTTANTLATSAQGLGKPGFKTSKFWLSLLSAILLWIEGHSVIPDGSQWAEILNSLLAVLPLGTYAVARGALKKAEATKTVLLPGLVGELAPPSGSPAPSEPTK